MPSATFTRTSLSRCPLMPNSQYEFLGHSRG